MRPNLIALTLPLAIGLGSATVAAPPVSRLGGASAAGMEGRPDAPVRRVQVMPGDTASGPSSSGPGPGAAEGIVPDPMPVPPMPASSDLATSGIGGQSLSLQAALYGAITSNPDLVTLRQTTASGPSAEAVEVARRFPTALNPTVWIDYRPITLIPNRGPGEGPPPGQGPQNFYRSGQGYFLFSIRQPIELGHQTTHRYGVARAALSQQRWNVMQAELTAIVQTYRLFQTAAYRREKLRVARQLAEFNGDLLTTLRRRLEANQAQAGDVALASVEARATGQMARAARQDYAAALADLGNIIGTPESAGRAEPLGEFSLPSYIPPVDEQAFIARALRDRPDIQSAKALVDGTCSAVRLARGDCIPTPVIGPQYGTNESGVEYVGLILVSALPVFNNGRPLVRQREAEHRRAYASLRQVQQRAIAQVRAATIKWNGASELVNESSGLTEAVSRDVAALERLFNEGQTDLTKLMQARQRLIQLENAQLDAVWAATQAQADLLLALGTPSLINALPGTPPAAAPPSGPPAPAPRTPATR